MGPEECRDKRMKLYITGVTSFLGHNVASELLRAGHEVIGVVRPNSKNKNAVEKLKCSSFKLLECDLQEISEIRDSADALIHFAWDGIGSSGRSNKEIQLKNIENAKKVFNTALEMNCRRFLFAGSQAEYGTGSYNRPDPVSEYGKAKLGFGMWAKDRSTNSMDFIHLRFFSVYGYGDHKTSLISSLIRAEIQGSELKLGPCDQMWNYMEISDCSAATAMIATHEAVTAGVYDIASNDSRILKEYVRQAHYVCGEHAQLQFCSRGNNAEGAADMHPNLEKLSALGFNENNTFECSIKSLYETVKGNHDDW